MKHQRIFTLLLATIILTMACASCGKDADSVSRGAVDAESGKILCRILDFSERLSEVTDGTREVSLISLDEAIWNIEALFNYTYAYPELACERGVAADTALYLPLNGHNDSVSMADLSTFYEQMYGAVGAIMQRTAMPNARLLVLDVEANAPTDNHIKITLDMLIGSVAGAPVQDTTLPWPGPFADGEWWWFGGSTGGSTSNQGDAAQQLTMKLNQYLVPVASGDHFYSYTGIRSCDTRSMEASDHPYENGYCEYYSYNPSGLTQDEMILDQDEMNFHFFGERNLVLGRLPNEFGIPNTHSVCGIQVYDTCQTVERVVVMARHWTLAFYGNRIEGMPGLGPERGEIEP